MLPTTVHPALLRKRLLEEQEQQSKEYTQNKHPLQPHRRISHQSHMPLWKKSPAHAILMQFILKLNEHAQGKAIHDEDWESNGVIESVKHLLDHVREILDKYPCEVDSSLSRFGNIAFRKFYDDLDAHIDALVHDTLLKGTIHENREWATKELAWYFKESWGNRTRIDFGTGHELSFAAFMACLWRLGLVQEKHADALVFSLYPHYLSVVRTVQQKYRLEPAGSRGVWGLDDYFFLVYVWGSAQLFSHEHIKPSDIHRESVLSAHKHDYLYLGAIAYITDVKKGPFAEHSPLLNDISSVPTWTKTNSGMLKMFEAEVMDKFVVVQHLCFGHCLPFDVDENVHSLQMSDSELHDADRKATASTAEQKEERDNVQQ